jgi:hypothetical protein
MANQIAQNEEWITAGGGLASEEDVDAAAKTLTRAPRGIFSAFPGATPKYAKNLGEEEKDFRETMARMFMQVPNYENFVGEYSEEKNMQQIAAVLGGQVSEGKDTTGGSGYMDFILQNVQHAFHEKMQVVEVLADDHVAYFFGQGTMTFSYSGTLINTKQDDQALNMLRLYAEFGRGSKLAARNTLISLRYDDVFVSGAITNLTYSLNAETEMAVPFSFNLLVKKLQLLPNPYSGVVTLSTPFAAASNGYLPFAQGSLDPGTKPTSPAATPAAATKLAISPAATEKTTEEKEDAEIEKGFGLRQKMEVATTLFGNLFGS